ncbi:malonate decarboxylase acyl carrier protein [Rhizosaccharibacter radicis]|uniref:Malonate decarboxylase acyl carrier protein n=1 Tax=Rhizosaccharibacter radicis TaxID=2782605 RepID=A0ABT1W1K9_9PROT|nr:malonate decarboxylase acyl carrier protein [Acetobacteraceae bacterium KSS12]
METLSFSLRAERVLRGTGRQAIVGVVASGNLEVLAERIEDGTGCRVEVSTAAEGFGDVWKAVVGDFVERVSPGGVCFSINDGGARPDTVMLRLMQAARVLESAS